MFKDDPNQLAKELLDEIKAGLAPGGKDVSLNELLAGFMALLIKLSAAADKRARVMTWLTIVITVLTGVLVWDALERHMKYVSGAPAWANMMSW